MPIPTWKTELRELAPNVFAYILGGGPNENRTNFANAGFVVGPDSVLVVDTLGYKEHIQAFADAIRSVTDKPVRHIINTHHHIDHTSGNYMYPDAEIVSSVGCRTGVLRELAGRREQARTGAPLSPAWRPFAALYGTIEMAPPTTTFTGEITYRYGDVEVRAIVVEPAHSEGDVVVYLPNERVLFAGDIGRAYVTPGAREGSVIATIRVIDRLAGLGYQRMVPGHGPLCGPSQMDDIQQYLVTVKREARERHAAGMSAVDAALDIDVGRFKEWNNPERIMEIVLRLYEEFEGRSPLIIPLEARTSALDAYVRKFGLQYA